MVDALLLPIAITSAAVLLVAILTVSVPELVTPPISIAFVLALSPRLIPAVPVSKTRPVAPVELPIVIVLAIAFPILIAPVPESISSAVLLDSLPMVIVLVPAVPTLMF